MTRTPIIYHVIFLI